MAIPSRALLGALSALGSLTPGISSAVDWSVTARAETGFQFYDFQQSPVVERTSFSSGNSVGYQTATISSREYKDTMPILGAGLSVVADRFFFDATVQGTFDGSDSDSYADSNTIPTSPFDFGVNLTNLGNTDADFDRLEYAFSVGYGVTQSFAVYAGWKWAETEFEEERRGNFQLNAELSDPFPFNFLRYEGDWQDKVEYDFKQDGPFLGAAYNWGFDGKLKGALTVNAALAFLDGEFEDVKQSPTTLSNVTATLADGQQVFLGSVDQIAGFSLSQPSFNGDTTAITLGVSWRGQTQIEGLSYILGINGYTYNFDADKGGIDGGDVTETVVNFKAGVSYRF